MPFSCTISARSIRAGVSAEQSATLAAGHVFRFVKTHGGQVADAAERPALVGGEERLGGVFDNEQRVSSRDVRDDIQLAETPA